jgi:hypothetical protein
VNALEPNGLYLPCEWFQLSMQDANEGEVRVAVHVGYYVSYESHSETSHCRIERPESRNEGAKGPINRRLALLIV